MLIMIKKKMSPLPLTPLLLLLAHQSIQSLMQAENIPNPTSCILSHNSLRCLPNICDWFANNKHLSRRRHPGSHGNSKKLPDIPWFISIVYNDENTAECCYCSFPSPVKRNSHRESTHLGQPRTTITALTESKIHPSPTTKLHLSTNPVNNYRKNMKKIQSLPSLLSLETDLHTRGYTHVIGSDDSGGAGCIAGPVVVASCCVLSPAELFRALLSESLVDGDDDPLLPQEQSQQYPLSLSKEEIQILKQTNDSKLSTAPQRREIYNVVMSHSDLFAITISRRSPRKIDETDVLTATKEAFAESIEELVNRWDLPRGKVYGVVDGKVAPKVFAHSSTEIEGESGTRHRTDETTLNDDGGGGRDGCHDNSGDGTKQGSNNNNTRFPVRPYINGDANVFTVALASIVAKVTRDNIMKHEIHVKYPEYGFDIHLGYGTRDHVERVHRLGSLDGIHRMSFKQVKGR
ncbi:hypothetical protein ACHAXS_011503 [Conticribra weissflogii]